MLSPSEQLLYNTVKIVSKKDGVPVSSGTGFYWRTSVDEGYAISLVTNKHVLEDCDEISIRVHFPELNSNSPSGVAAFVEIVLNAGGIIYHPDPDIDLCAISMSGVVDRALADGKRVFMLALDETLIPDEPGWNSLDAIEEIVMIGCPNGLYDEVNALPIVRRGATASHPAFRYNGKDEFLIDAACFPGSSGSPVLIYSSGSYFNKNSLQFEIGQIRVKLIGVLYSGPTVQNEGEYLSTALPRVMFSSMMHLGWVLRSSNLLEIDKLIRVTAKK